MLKINEIDLIEDDKKYLIDYANLNQGLIANQKEFLNQKQFKFFLNKPSMGLPLMLPFGLDCFDYKNVKEIFELNRKDIYKKIFRTKINFYHAAETFFKYGNVFCVGAKPKNKHERIIKLIKKINSSLIKKISDLNNKNKIIGAIQTRNIPHIGHEKIINRLLKECDYVFIKSNGFGFDKNL